MLDTQLIQEQPELLVDTETEPDYSLEVSHFLDVLGQVILRMFGSATPRHDNEDHPTDTHLEEE